MTQPAASSAPLNWPPKKPDMEAEVRYRVEAKLKPGSSAADAYKTSRVIESLSETRNLPIGDTDIQRFVDVRVELGDYRGLSRKAVAALLRDLAGNELSPVRELVVKQEDTHTLLDAHKLRDLSSRLVEKRVAILGIGPKTAQDLIDETGFLIATAEANLADNIIT